MVMRLMEKNLLTCYSISKCDHSWLLPWGSAETISIIPTRVSFAFSVTWNSAENVLVPLNRFMFHLSNYDSMWVIHFLLENQVTFNVTYFLCLGVKAQISIQKAFGEKKLAPLTDLKSINIMQSFRPQELDGPLKK